MSYLIDTNVLSELRKGERCDPSVASWFREAAGSEKFLSVLTVGEIRRGIEGVRRRDLTAAQALDDWLGKLLESYAPRLLPISAPISETWGRLMVPDPLPVVDGLLAATALHFELILVTRNVQDISRTDVSWVNPFTPAER